MFKYILLGLVQGATEFLPVSSSAHLIFIEKFLNMDTASLALPVVLHLGTVCALLVFFCKDIIKALRNTGTIFFIIVVTVITGTIGMLGRHFFESLFSSPRYAAAALLVTGFILLATKRARSGVRDMLGIIDALILGVAQGLAIIPGISRSGITISTLIFRRIDKETCFRFSFLAGIPAILGAALLEAGDIRVALNGQVQGFAVGFIVSFIVGLAALWLLRSIVIKAKLYYFSYYCFIVGIFILIFVK